MTKKHQIKFYIWNWICATVRPFYNERYSQYSGDFAEGRGDDFNEWLNRRWFSGKYKYEASDEKTETNES